MFPGKEGAAYPTQWALNPSAYQNMDSRQVDWASLAQQWIAMKEATVTMANAAPVPPPPPPIKENSSPEPGPPPAWSTSSNNSWGNINGNQWGKHH